jgi:hypothetical protein
MGRTHIWEQTGRLVEPVVRPVQVRQARISAADLVPAETLQLTGPVAVAQVPAVPAVTHHRLVQLQLQQMRVPVVAEFHQQ